MVKSVLVLVTVVSLTACSTTDVVTGGIMKRKYRSGLYLAKRSKATVTKKQLMKEVDRTSQSLLVTETEPEMFSRDGIKPLERGVKTFPLDVNRDIVEGPDYISSDVSRNLYWLEEDDSTLNNRFLDITLGVLCGLAAIAAFIGLIYGVVELTKVIAGTSSIGMSTSVALLLLAFGLPIAIAVVWTLVALSVKLFRGE